MNVADKKDLIILVADQTMHKTIESLLKFRLRSLGIHQLQYSIFPFEGEHDPGSCKRGHEFLRNFIKQYEYALLIFDLEGCGQDHIYSRSELEKEMEEKLSQSGWADRAAAIVIDPELEIWTWSDSSHVDEILGWKDRIPDLRTWLVNKEYLTSKNDKPNRPKEAMMEALKKVKKTFSSALHMQLAKKVSLNRCADPAFSKLKSTLQDWFSDN